MTILQWTETTWVISKWDTFWLFSYLIILLLVLSNSFIVSGVKSSRLYHVFILNVILLSIILAYIIERLLDFSPCFFYNILKMILNILYRIRPTVQLKYFISCWSWYFKLVVFVWFFHIFARVCSICWDLIK